MAEKTGKGGANSKSQARKKRNAASTPVVAGRRRGSKKDSGRDATGKAKKKLKQDNDVLVELSVVGLNHRVTATEFGKLFDALPVKCRLVREPENEYDENAIKVIAHPKRHIGYLRRGVASSLAPRLDKKITEIVSCELVSLDEDTEAEGILKVLTRTHEITP